MLGLSTAVRDHRGECLKQKGTGHHEQNESVQVTKQCRVACFMATTTTPHLPLREVTLGVDHMSAVGVA